MAAAERPHCFAVRRHWDDREIASQVAEWIEWQAPRLPTLQDLDDAAATGKP